MCGDSIDHLRGDAEVCGATCRRARSRKADENKRDKRDVTLISGGIDADALAEAVAAIVVDRLAERATPDAGGLPDDAVGLLKIIAENSSAETPMIRKMANALEEIADRLKRLESQPRAPAPRHTYAPSHNAPAPEILDDIELEVTEAESGVDANANFIYSMLMISGHEDEAQAMRDSMAAKARPAASPKPLAGTDVVFDAPDFDDDEFEI